jgi:hypothetical protein
MVKMRAIHQSTVHLGGWTKSTFQAGGHMNDTCERLSLDIEELEGRVAPSSFSFSYHGYTASGTITTSGGATVVSGTLITPTGSTFSGTFTLPGACSD